jgi:HSP20 family protein
MNEKQYNFDLGRIMDEAFRIAQDFGQAFGEHMSHNFPSAEEMREKFRERFKWHGTSDFYPHYSYPPMNIYLAKDKSLVFEIAVAGFEEKDVELRFKGDYLSFSAKAPTGEPQEEGVQYFKRRLKLRDIEEQRFYAPEDKFDREKVQAHFKNGLLRVVVPAREEPAEQQGIKVRIVREDEEPGSRSTAKGGPSRGRASGQGSPKPEQDASEPEAGPSEPEQGSSEQ